MASYCIKCWHCRVNENFDALFSLLFPHVQSFFSRYECDLRIHWLCDGKLRTKECEPFNQSHAVTISMSTLSFGDETLTVLSVILSKWRLWNVLSSCSKLVGDCQIHIYKVSVITMTQNHFCFLSERTGAVTHCHSALSATASCVFSLGRYRRRQR